MAPKGKGGGKNDEEDEDLFLPIKDVTMRLRQGPMNFGAYLTGDKDKPVILAAHKRKNPEVLGKLARKQAGTPKGCFGQLTLEEGGLLTFLAATEDAPSSLAKRIRVMLRNEGFSKFKVRVLLPGGVELGEEEGEDGEDGQTPAAPATGGAPPDESQKDPLEQMRAEAQAQFDALDRAIVAAGDAVPPGALRKIDGLRAMFAAEIVRDPRKAMGIVQLLRKTVEAAGLSLAPPDGTDAPPSGRESRASALADLEKGIDALLAQYS